MGEPRDCREAALPADKRSREAFDAEVEDEGGGRCREWVDCWTPTSSSSKRGGPSLSSADGDVEGDGA